MADDKKFVDGMIVKRKPKAPDFVKCSLSFKCADFVTFMKANHKKGWLNVDLKMSKGGKLYAEVDTWEPEAKEGGDWGGDTPTAKPAPTDDRDYSDGDPDGSEVPF